MFFGRHKQNHSKIYMKSKSPQNSRNNFDKDEKVEGISAPDFKASTTATVLKTVRKDPPREHIHGQWIS